MKKFLCIALFISGIAQGAGTKERIPYYGELFYTLLERSDHGLKEEIQEVLQSYHLRTKGMDEIRQDCTGNCYRHAPLSYKAARVFLLTKFYLVKLGDGSYGVREVYCQRVFSGEDFSKSRPGPGQLPDDRVVNVEHTWPQSRFSKRFRADEQKSDLHHLFPTSSEMNSARSSWEFGEVETIRHELACPLSRLGEGEGGTVFEPPTQHRGNVARALFYFSIKYELPIQAEEEAALRAWNEGDPVDEEERRRNEEIFALQFSRNPFVDYPEVARLIQDF